MVYNDLNILFPDCLPLIPSKLGNSRPSDIFKINLLRINLSKIPAIPSPPKISNDWRITTFCPSSVRGDGGGGVWGEGGTVNAERAELVAETCFTKSQSPRFFLGLGHAVVIK